MPDPSVKTMKLKLIAFLAAGLLPSHAGAGPIDLEQDLGGLDLTVTLAPKASPEALRIDNNSAMTVTCSAHFTGADQNRTENLTIKPGATGTIRIPRNRGGTPRNAELKCAERTPDKK